MGFLFQREVDGSKQILMNLKVKIEYIKDNKNISYVLSILEKIQINHDSADSKLIQLDQNSEEVRYTYKDFLYHFLQNVDFYLLILPNTYFTN